MNSSEINELNDYKGFREVVNSIIQSFPSDVKPFIHSVDQCSFRRQPDSPSTPDTISIATTSTTLMAIALNKMESTIYGSTYDDKLKNLVEKIYLDKFDSADLSADNAFTTIIVMRTIATLIENNSISADYKDKILDIHPDSPKHYANKTFSQITESILADFPESISVTGYNPRPEIAYWFAYAAFTLHTDFTQEQIEKIAHWGYRELTRQITYITSRNHALIDPIAMAMAACLMQRIKRIYNEMHVPVNDKDGLFPSNQEMIYAIELFFSFQRDSLLWDNYFPLFHYNKPESGANYCWAWEVLEAILAEFPELISKPIVYKGIKLAVEWAQISKLKYKYQDTLYSGWNSGSLQKTLLLGIPECWAIGSIYMCLARLSKALSSVIKDELIKKYSKKLSQSIIIDRTIWDNIIDTEVEVFGDKKSLKEIIKSNIIDPAERNPQDKKNARSALLFGPPGTAKTSIVNALAKYLGWPLVELTPSEFLSEGMDNIYLKSSQIFEDLNDIGNAVILFDEIDALVQNRQSNDGDARGIMQQFLTTSMLPKLAKLHDLGNVLFFLCTNYRKDYDEAVTRPGRFDLILLVDCLSYQTKVDNLNLFLSDIQLPDWELARTKIQGWARNEGEVITSIDRMTFGEFKSFLKQLSKGQSLKIALDNTTKQEFITLTKLWGKDYIILKANDQVENPLLKNYLVDKKASRIQ